MGRVWSTTWPCVNGQVNKGSLGPFVSAIPSLNSGFSDAEIRRVNSGLMLGQRLRRWPNIKPEFTRRILLQMVAWRISMWGCDRSEDALADWSKFQCQPREALWRPYINPEGSARRLQSNGPCAERISRVVAPWSYQPVDRWLNERGFGEVLSVLYSHLTYNTWIANLSLFQRRMVLISRGDGNKSNTLLTSQRELKCEKISSVELVLWWNTRVSKYYFLYTFCQHLLFNCIIFYCRIFLICNWFYISMWCQTNPPTRLLHKLCQ